MANVRLVIFLLFTIVSSGFAVVEAQTELVFSAIDSRSGLSDNNIRNITQLSDGRMVITTEGITNIYDGSTFRQLHQPPGSAAFLTGYTGFHHSYVEGNRIWIKNYKKLLLIDANAASYIQRPDSVLKDMGIVDEVADLFLDIYKNYWIKTTTDKLFFYSPKSKTTRLFLSQISYPERNKKEDLYDIAVVDNQVFLFYSNGLILCYDLRTAELRYKIYSLAESERVLYNRTLMVVQDGSVLYMLRNNQKGLMQLFDTKSRSFRTVLKTDYWLNTISIDSRKNIWVSCRKGLWHINKGLSIHTLFTTFRLIDGTDVTNEASTLYHDSQGGFWMGTLNHGLLYYHADRFKFKNIGKIFFGSQSQDINVNCFSETPQHHILIGTSSGLYDYNPANSALLKLSDRFPAEYFPSTKTNTENRNWFSSYINRNKTVWGNRTQDFSAILRDRRGLVWLGTRDGLYVLQLATNKISSLYTDDGLVNNSIKGLLEDRQGRIWVTTSGGISRIEVREKTDGLHFDISNFNHYDGLITDEFIAEATFMSGSGLLFFGGVNGFNVIDPTQPWTFIRLQKPIFTGLTLFGTKIKPGESYNGHTILHEAISTTSKLELSHNQNFITVEFSALNYVNPTQTHYRYRMEGVDGDWREIVASNGTGSASYTNLAPGTYIFKVKAANNSNEWNDNFAQMVIVVKPPFWKTPVAYSLYLVVALLLIYLLLSYYKKQTHSRLERQNEEKLNQMKFAFFTNISHEFRTPLTLIITPLEAFLNEIKGTAYEPRLRSIYRHAQDLQNLVNQLLDFRRMEMSGEKLNLTYGNMVDFVQQFKDLFNPLAEEKQIAFNVETNLSELFLYFDSNKLYKVINNLLSNAFKHTPQGGKIRIRLTSESGLVCLDVIDSGTGIPESELSQVFDRFYQASNAQGGSGIGLHLVKEYVQLHSGKIAVQSEPGVQTVFSVTLPINLSPDKTEMTVATEEPSDDISAVPQSDFTLLVVEDNDELRRFLVMELQKKYRVLEAPDGDAGLRLAQSELPDLIISDVMMPKMDGLELCKRIKSNLETSHIPVILLTARSSEDHKLSGYQSGADEYLSKPFNLNILLLRIDKLIDQQKLRKNEFAKKLEVNPKEITITSIDEQLIQRALACIEQNMDNADYSVLQFSQDMNMDRTVLYKKLQSITGLAPSDFIRSIRLKRAAQLLSQGQYPVAEVAEMVGFNTPKYFTKYFKEAFGVTPSQYGPDGRNKSNI